MNYKRKLMQAARAYYKTMMTTWESVYHDKLSTRDVKNHPDLRALIIRYTIRWLIEDYSDIHRDDPIKVDNLFRDIYFQICGQHAGTEEFPKKFECCNDNPRVVAKVTWQKICLAYQGDSRPCATACLHCRRIGTALATEDFKVVP